MMLENLVMLAFVAVLMFCVAFGVPTAAALIAGYVIFILYGMKKGYSVPSLLKMSWSGLGTVIRILFIFLLIGILTALWRGAGTIPEIIAVSAGLIHPSGFLLLSFLLNCAVSVLTGTSFGTAATMGVNPLFTGGAVVSGIFFGDRCSPVSTSALLVSELTGTDLYGNIRRMLRSCLVPFVLTCAAYLALGAFSRGGSGAMDVKTMFSGHFTLHWILLVPALLILVMAAFRAKVKYTLLASAAAAAVCCLVFQKMTVHELIRLMIFGYRSEDPQLAAMMNGGGFLSMVQVSVIVGISSAYAGIFEGTGLLLGIKRYVEAVSRRITPFGGILAVSVVTSMISFNQTLAIILTDQLTKDAEPDKEKRALALEDTVVLMAALVPWSIAGNVPISTIGAPMASLCLAFYLIIVPLWNFARALTQNRKNFERN